MANNFTMRLTAAGQVFISKNRKLSHPWRWGRALVGAVVLATAFILFTSSFLAWADLQYITQSYQISQAQEIQKQYLDLNNKLRIELASLTAISRLERLAAEYGMGAPQPSQVVKLP
jgi:cell division protein FtsL